MVTPKREQVKGKEKTYFRSLLIIYQYLRDFRSRRLFIVLWFELCSVDSKTRELMLAKSVEFSKKKKKIMLLKFSLPLFTLSKQQLFCHSCVFAVKQWPNSTNKEGKNILGLENVLFVN